MSPQILYQDHEYTGLSLMIPELISTWPERIRRVLRKSLDRNVTAETTLHPNPFVVFELYETVDTDGSTLEPRYLETYKNLHLANTAAARRFLFGGPWEAGTFASMDSEYVVGLKDDGTIYLAIESDGKGSQVTSMAVAIRGMLLEDGDESDSRDGVVSLDESTREWWSLIMGAVDEYCSWGKRWWYSPLHVYPTSLAHDKYLYIRMTSPSTPTLSSFNPTEQFQQYEGVSATNRKIQQQLRCRPKQTCHPSHHPSTLAMPTPHKNATLTPAGTAKLTTATQSTGLHLTTLRFSSPLITLHPATACRTSLTNRPHTTALQTPTSPVHRSTTASTNARNM
ncbi:unnamed protein product [Periconia digitata]|uniref:Uncharacterized protein n=1 Tax=Periconia digitata TaxID=1303443 RepID=A0A9W4UW70_9PLEO|nr:unnamed protein product [Periconia digitata]